jgi:hypothetical protein
MRLATIGTTTCCTFSLALVMKKKGFYEVGTWVAVIGRLLLSCHDGPEGDKGQGHHHDGLHFADETE